MDSLNFLTGDGSITPDCLGIKRLDGDGQVTIHADDLNRGRTADIARSHRIDLALRQLVPRRGPP